MFLNLYLLELLYKRHTNNRKCDTHGNNYFNGKLIFIRKEKYMKKILSLLLSFFSFMFLTVNVPLTIYAEENSKTINYNESLDGFVLENITVQEVMNAMNSNPEFIPQNTLKRSKHMDIETINNLGLDVARAAQYIEDYRLVVNVRGVYGENVPVYYTCSMVMTTVNYKGVDYAQFVSFNLSPVHWLGSNSYTFAQGTGKVKATIRNGGATINTSQIIQLQTATTISVNTGLSAGWINVGSGTSSTSYFRSQAATYNSYYNLPLINIVQ